MLHFTWVGTTISCMWLTSWESYLPRLGLDGIVRECKRELAQLRAEVELPENASKAPREAVDDLRLTV